MINIIAFVPTSLYSFVGMKPLYLLTFCFALLFVAACNNPEDERAEKLRPMYSTGLDVKGDSTYHTIPNYRFANHLGDTTDLDEMRGNYYVADFFFTTCPGICIRLSDQMERVQEGLKDEDKVKLLSFSVDEVKDTIPALKAYADAHGAIEGKWYFFRGSTADIFNLAKSGFFVAAEEEKEPGDFMHSEKLILVDDNGHIRGYYNGLDSVEVDQLVSDVKFLLSKEN